jgi:hypothetical protein
MSYTLSEIQADFGHGATHVKNSASPFLEFEFGSPTPRVFKSTMVKHGGPVVAWQQPVLLTGANSSNLTVIAKMHKALTADKTIGVGSIDLGASAGQNGFTVVPLRSTSGASAGEVRFMVTRGEAPGAAGISQGTPGSNGIIEGVGGPGRNVEGGLAPVAGAGAGGLGAGGTHAGIGEQAGYGGQQGGIGGAGYNSQPGGLGASQQPGYGGQQGGIGGAGYNSQPGGLGAGGGQQAGGVPAFGGGGQQLAQTGQQGMVGGQQGGAPGGMRGGMAPQEFSEKRSHATHDHDESETLEVVQRTG